MNLFHVVGSTGEAVGQQVQLHGALAAPLFGGGSRYKVLRAAICLVQDSCHKYLCKGVDDAMFMFDVFLLVSPLQTHPGCFKHRSQHL